jgi:hypothetical protein
MEAALLFPLYFYPGSALEIQVQPVYIIVFLFEFQGIAAAAR